MAIENVFNSEGGSRKWIVPILLFIGALLILWFVVPRAIEYFSPKQEEVIPAEVKAPTWQETLPDAPKKFTFTIPVEGPPPVVGTTNPSTKRSSK